MPGKKGFHKSVPSFQHTSVTHPFQNLGCAEKIKILCQLPQFIGQPGQGSASTAVPGKPVKQLRKPLALKSRQFFRNLRDQPGQSRLVLCAGGGGRGRAGVRRGCAFRPDSALCAGIDKNVSIQRI